MIIVDTSVAMKWLLTTDEAYVEKARILLKNHIRQKDTISVPELFYYEIVNALATKTPLTLSKATMLITKIYEFNFEKMIPGETEMKKASMLAKKHKTSVYDMVYAVLAMKNKAVLVTADEKFIQKTGFKFVKHLKEI